jgi:hypothetical protein
VIWKILSLVQMLTLLSSKDGKIINKKKQAHKTRQEVFRCPEKKYFSWQVLLLELTPQLLKK